MPFISGSHGFCHFIIIFENSNPTSRILYLSLKPIQIFSFIVNKYCFSSFFRNFYNLLMPHFILSKSLSVYTSIYLSIYLFIYLFIPFCFDSIWFHSLFQLMSVLNIPWDEEGRGCLNTFKNIRNSLSIELRINPDVYDG